MKATISTSAILYELLDGHPCFVFKHPDYYELCTSMYRVYKVTKHKFLGLIPYKTVERVAYIGKNCVEFIVLCTLCLM